MIQILIVKMRIILIKVMIQNWKKNFLEKNKQSNQMCKKSKKLKSKNKKNLIKMISKKKLKM